LTTEPATLSSPPATEHSDRFVPAGHYRGTLDDFDYVEEEWFASGEAHGHPYRTSLTVRRPRDAARFSGLVVVEPVHAASAAPVWIYTSTYLMRTGHAWAAICSQKSVLDAFVKPASPERYAELDIWSDAPPPEARGIDALRLPPDRAGRQARLEDMRRVNVLSSPILAHVGAALASSAGPFAGLGVRHVILAGHSQTGAVVTDYILNEHDTNRLVDGTPVYQGFFPSGAPSVCFGPRDVPIVQVVSDGDIASHNGPWREGRDYRRDDSDDASDRYRLYELAGVAHMGTRYPPYSDNATWQIDPTGTAGTIPPGAVMNSLPHDELFHVGMHHLVQWVAGGVTPPRADRIEVASDGLFLKDEYGNTRGGVRCAQMDVPRLRYISTPGADENGEPAFGVVGFEEPLAPETLKRLYHDHADYVDHFNRRLDALIAEGWFLAEDAPGMRAEAESAPVP
jgi:hypothetical protein